MNNRTITLLIVVLLSFNTYAQKFGIEPGIVTLQELEMTSYEKDKDAEAVVLFDIAKSKFVRGESGFDIMFKRTQRIKVLSEAGLDYAEFEVPLYQEGGIYETVRDIKGVTFNLDNGVKRFTELDLSTCFEEKQNEFWTIMKIPMPDVKVGSVIELAYTVYSQHIFNLRDWEFQRRIPTVYSKYQVWQVPFYEYMYILQGAGKFTESDWHVDEGIKEQYGSVEYNYVVNNFVMKDVPAFKGEEFISSYNDYVMKLDFQLSVVHSPSGGDREVQTTWEKMIKEYNSDVNFGKYIKKSQKMLSNVLNPETLQPMDDSAKMHYIIDAVKDNISWDGYYGKMATGSPKKLVEKKSGSVGSINLFLIGLLREAGFEAYPILISTRSHGRVYTQYPFSHFLNYVIVAVKKGDGYILTDATTPLTINHRIPPRCINELGLVVKKAEKTEWMPLKVDFTSDKEYKFDIELSAEHLSTKVDVKLTEYEAYDMRIDYVKDSTQLEKDIDERYENSEIELLSLENLNEPSLPIKYSYKIESTPVVINDKIYIDPFMSETLSENPLKATKRDHPIDMTYPTRRSYFAEIEIPEGYKVEHFPMPTKINNDSFYLLYMVKGADNKIKVEFEYIFKKGKYPASEYHKLKYYFNEIVKKTSEKFVLVKTDIPE